MASPKVTVLMSVYNSERYVRYALESILQQTYADFEFLIINDGSTDGSAEILQSYDDPRICILTNAQNIGLTRSLNKGLRHARGEYVARIDADDISLPMRLEMQTRCLDQHPEVGLVATGYDVINESGKVLRTDARRMSPEGLYYVLTFSNCLCHSAVMFRKQLVLTLGGYDPTFDLVEDLELWYRVSRCCKIESVNRVLTKWRLSKGGLSDRFQAEQRAAEVAFLTKSMSELMGSDGAVDDIKCFQDLYHLHAQATYESFCELVRVNDMLVAACPPWLDRRTLEQQATAMLLRYLAIMTLHGHITVVIRVCFKFQSLFVRLIKQKAMSFMDSLSLKRLTYELRHR